MSAVVEARVVAPLIAAVLDEGTFRSWEAEPAVGRAASRDYARTLETARERSGVTESVTTGEGLLDGRRVAVIISEFDFLGGSMGIEATRRLVEAMKRATAERLPLLASPRSGGTRMQEGTAAFVGMIAIASAAAAHRRAGLPYFVYLRNPTTGGAMASWASLGHVAVGEPGALLGFLGPRVYEALHGQPFPRGVQTAENLFRHGVIDGLARPEELRHLLVRVLALLCEPAEVRKIAPLPVWEGMRAPVWESVERTRRASRPGVRELLRLAATDVIPLNGTGQGERDFGLFLARARFGGQSCVVVGQDRHGQREQAPIGPEGLREARRGLRLAEELGLPLVTVVDTPGGRLSQDAEQGALAGEIANTLAQLMVHDGVTVSLIMGEGTGGAALALLPADRSLSAEHGWLAPLPPEGASVIMYRDTAHAREVAEGQGIGSADLLTRGIIDGIIVERPDAADEVVAFCRRTADAIESAIGELSEIPVAERLRRRASRYERLVT